MHFLLHVSSQRGQSNLKVSDVRNIQYHHFRPSSRHSAPPHKAEDAAAGTDIRQGGEKYATQKP